MRIVAGKFRSRVIEAVPGMETRPTADKIKEAIFSRIGPYFHGGQMLDLFGGSGNMGFEALSRGMDHVVFVDVSKVACRVIAANAKKLQVEANCEILTMPYQNALSVLQKQQRKFDLIYLDPPYKEQQISEILSFLATTGMVSLHGLVVCECLKEDGFLDTYEELQKIKDVTYGSTRITIYERNSL